MFTVVIPLYNKESHIYRSVRSVLDQSYNNLELIIVNDGSTDDSMEVVSQIHDDRIKIIEQANAGVSKARNTGIRNASNDFIAFLDADDYWTPNYLEFMYAIIKNYSECIMYGTRQVIITSKHEHLSYIGKNVIQEVNYIDDYFLYAQNAFLFHASAIIVSKKKIIDNNVFFDEKLKMGEDLDFYIRVSLYGSMIFVNRPLTYYSTISENRAMQSKKLFTERLLGNFEKYTSLYKSNTSFKILLNKYILSCWALLIYEKEKKENIMKMIANIDKRSLTIYEKIYFNLPYIIKKILNIFRY